MRFPQGTQFRTKTYSSGKRVRQAIYNNRILDTKPMPTIKQTKTRRALKKRKRRIGIR